MEYVIAIVYISCCVLAWFILVDEWRRDLDLDLGEAIVIAVFSIFGPVSLVVAVIAWVIGWTVDRMYKSGHKAIWRKK